MWANAPRTGHIAVIGGFCEDPSVIFKVSEFTFLSFFLLFWIKEKP